MPAYNFFSPPPATGLNEEFFTLLERPGIKIERIASYGQSSPSGFWYDQPNDEWVMLVQGHAALEFLHGDLVEMNSGDTLLIPAHQQHRVSRTSEDTLWLAVHFTANSEA